MKNINPEHAQAICLKILGFIAMCLIAAEFLGLVVLPKTSTIPSAVQLGAAFLIALTLFIIPLPTLQGWINKIAGKKIDKLD